MRRTMLVFLAVLASVPASAQLDPQWDVLTSELLVGEAPDVMPVGGGVPAGSSLTFRALDGDSGPSNLSDELTINGTAMELKVSVDARDLVGTSWPALTGGTLSETGTGTSPTADLPAPFTESGARRVTYQVGKPHLLDGDAGDIGTEDFAVELVFNPGANLAAGAIFGTYEGTRGWGLLQDAGTLRFYMRDADSSIVASSLGTMTANAWRHVLVFVDRDEASTNGLIPYTNGVAGSGSNQSGQAASLVSATNLYVGGNAVAGDESVAFGRVWTCPAATPNCFAGGSTNATETAAIAARRFAQLTGVYASTGLGARTPTTTSRSTSAYVDIDRDCDGTTRLFLVGANWPRVGKRREATGGECSTGLLYEQSDTNLAIYSQDFSTGWLNLVGGDTLSVNGMAAPDGSLTADGFIYDATSSDHSTRQVHSSLTVQPYAHSVWMKAGTKTWGRVSNNTVGGEAWIDLSDCSFGTTTGGVDYVSATGPDGWCFVAVVTTAVSGGNQTRITCSDADNTLASSGDGVSVACWLWQAQVEAGSYPSSGIATTTASASRSADSLRYDCGANCPSTLPFTIESTHLLADQVYWPPFSDGFGASDYFVSVGLTNVSYVAHKVTSGDNVVFLGRSELSTQWTLNGVGDQADGEIHTMRSRAAADDYTAYLDGAAVDVDATVAMVDLSGGLIYVGETGVGGNKMQGALISNIRIWSDDVTPEEAP